MAIDFSPGYLNIGLAYFEKGDVWAGLTNIKESLKGGPELQKSVNKLGYVNNILALF
jgi:hypothetical protein